MATNRNSLKGLRKQSFETQSFVMLQVISFKIHISKSRNTALISQEGTRNQGNRDVTKYQYHQYQYYLVLVVLVLVDIGIGIGISIDISITLRKRYWEELLIFYKV